MKILSLTTKEAIMLAIGLYDTNLIEESINRNPNPIENKDRFKIVIDECSLSIEKIEPRS